MTDEEDDAIGSEDAATRARVIAMGEEGFTYHEIAEELGLNRQQVQEILREEDVEEEEE